MMTAAFVFTLSVTILNVFRLVSIMVGNSISMPSWGVLSPTHGVFMYPSFLFQVWFWTDKLNIIEAVV